MCAITAVAATADRFDSTGHNPLISAAKGLHGRCARLLLVAGASPDLQVCFRTLICQL